VVLSLVADRLGSDAASMEQDLSSLSLSAGRVPVLMYHRVAPSLQAQEWRYAVESARFRAHLDWLAKNGWVAVSLAAFVAWHARGEPLPPRSVLITFDDGFAGLHEHAFPALRALGWPAVVFLVSGLIGGRDTWMSRDRGKQREHALLGVEQIAEMARHNIDFQSHSASHADLTTLDDDALRREVAGSRESLQSLLGTPVEHFAYPFGRYDDRVRAAVQAAGYRMAFSVQPGFNRIGADPLAIRRIDVTGKDSTARFGRKVKFGSNDGGWSVPCRYALSRLAARVGLY
jgi:peptidoglycan/xylan/chitin deacetylase (PgdA/CDA1 family)